MDGWVDEWVDGWIDWLPIHRVIGYVRETGTLKQSLLPIAMDPEEGLSFH